MNAPESDALTETIRSNRRAVQEAVRKEAKSAFLETVPEPVLVAVSKRQPDERIKAALKAGQRVFGENKVQEADAHWAERRNQYPDLELHLIGPLQTNKVNAAMGLFDVIQSVDRPKLVDKIAQVASRDGRCPDLFVQVNTGEEPQKAGVLPGDLDALIHQIKEHALPLKGLMCIPPVGEDAALHFALLKTLRDRFGLTGLSMGMSADYPLAAVMGATHIRVGTAIFGARDS